MAEWFNHKYFVALLLVIGRLHHADSTENSEIDMEILASHNQLQDSMIDEYFKLAQYVYERSVDLCKKMHDKDICENDTSKDSENKEFEETGVAETHETGLNHCINHVYDRLNPTDRGYSNRVEKVLLHKFGFEDIQKVVNRKYEEFFIEIVRQIDEYLKAMTPEQQNGTTARNLKGWSSKITEASTLAHKKMAFIFLMRYLK